MATHLRRFPLYYSLLTLGALGAAPLRASVAYISNCCSHPSTVSVFQTNGGRQTAQWAVGTGAYDAVFSPDGSTAYISDNVANAISVVRVATGKTVATIHTGFSELWMVISRDGSKLYAESYEYAYLSHIVAIDTSTNLVTQTLAMNAYLGPMALTPDGTTLYVNSSFSANDGLKVVDTGTLTVSATVQIYVGVSVAVTPDGKFAYIPNFGGRTYSPNVAVMDTSTNAVVANIPLDPNMTPTFAQISPDGSMVWVSQFLHLGHATPTIAVIQTSTNQVTGHIKLLRHATPGAMVFARHGGRAYVTDSNSAVDVVDVAQLKAVSEIRSLGSVNGPAISPDGKKLLLPNSGSSQVAAINQADGARLARIPVGDMDHGSQLYLEYGAAAASPDGTRVYATNYSSSNVSAIDTATKSVVASVSAPGSPVGVVVSPDGSKVYTANSYGNSVTVIDAVTFAAKTIRLPQFGYPTSIAITPDGSKVYVADDNAVPDFGEAKCYVFGIDTASNQVVSSIRVPYPMAVAASPDGTKVYVVGRSTSLYTIATASDTIVATLELANSGGQQPITSGIAVTPDGTRLFADNGQSALVVEVDLSSNKVMRRIRVGNNAAMLALTPDGSQVWVGDYVAESVGVIDVASGSVVKTIPLGNQSYGIAFGPQ